MKKTAEMYGILTKIPIRDIIVLELVSRDRNKE
jgi:hypothetical protein